MKALLQVTDLHSSAYSTEEAFVNRDKVPEKGTAVTVILGFEV